MVSGMETGPAMKIKEIVRHVTIEFSEEELQFVIDILRASENNSAINLAASLRELTARNPA
jgi:uncharacterized protein YfbU (UPF0304 family)